MNIIPILKAQQWEKCKGELRALVMLQGSYDSTEVHKSYSELQSVVEKFIQNVEDEGLQE